MDGKKMLKRLARACILLAVCGLLLTAVAVAPLADDPSQDPRRLGRDIFMRIKLKDTGKVLEGIVTRDFQLIEEGAQGMHEMSEAAEWPRAQDKTYEHYGIEFRRLCSKLSEMARDKNLEGVSFTYTQLTASCITCHEHVFKSLKRAPDPSGPFQLIPNAPTRRRP